MKNVPACISAREGRESSFHRCGSSVKLVQTCLCVGKTCTEKNWCAIWVKLVCQISTECAILYL